jgi:hypothetical protein
MLMNVRDEGVREFALFDEIEEITETLRPSDGTKARGLRKFAGVELVDELSKDAGHIVESTAVVGVTDDLERRRFGRRSAHSAPRRILLHHGCAREIMPRREFDADFTARERAAILGDHHLEALRPMMGGPMKLGSAEEGDVVALAQVIHELRDELLRGQATQAPIFRGNDDVKATKGSGDLAAALKTAESCSNGG